MSGRVFSRIAPLAAVLALTLALPAFAQTSPTTSAYGGQQGEVLGNFNSGGGKDGNLNGGGGKDDVIPPPTAPTGPAGQEAPTQEAPTLQAPAPTKTTPVVRGVDAPTPSPSVAAGELPFTGLEAGLVALFGLALLGSGFAMRRVSRSAA